MSDKQGAPTLPPLTGGGGNNGGSNGGAPQQTVLPSSGSSNQAIGVTRIVNLSSATPRVSVVSVAAAGGSSGAGTPAGSNAGGGGASGPALASASASSGRQNKLVLTTSPKLVRTSIGNMLLTPGQQQQQATNVASSGSSSQPQQPQTPPAKKKRQIESSEKQQQPIGQQQQNELPADPMGYKRRIIEHKLKRLRAVRDKYNENIAEFFFLREGGNLLEFLDWQKKPPTKDYLEFLKQQRLEPEDYEEELLLQQPQQQTKSPAAPPAVVASTTLTTTDVATVPVVTTAAPAPSATAPLPATSVVATPTTTTTTATTVTSAPPAGNVAKSTAPAPATLPTAMTASTTPVVATTVTTTPATPRAASATSTSLPTANVVTATTTTLATPISTSVTTPPPTMTTTTTSQNNAEVTVSGGTPVAVSTTLPPAVAQLSQQGGTPMVVDSPKSNTATANNPVSDKVSATNPVDKPATPPISSAQPIVKLVKLSASSIASSSCDTASSNQEQIVEKAKQEAYVMQRIAELHREGLWSEKRLPKVQEPPRPKTHWDYLLEEMVWLSTDFAQERKWKKSAAKKCARMVQKYFQEKALQAQKAEKLEELRLKKIAGFIAKEIKTFWTNVEKLVEYKQQTRLEEKRKKALDQQLNFIVGQTEKYSEWLQEGLNKTEGNLSIPASMHSSRISSPIPTEKNSDDDFKPNQCSDDDEETIAKAEEEMKSNHKEEIELLKKESELPLEDLLKDLPPNYLEERDKSISPEPREVVEEESNIAEGKDTEFTVASDETSDDEEDTIQEQEKLEKNVDHKQELEDLKAENEMSIDELMAKYGAADTDIPMEVEDSGEESDDDEEEEISESENETESEDETQDDSQTQSDEETAVGLKSLLEDLSDENKSLNQTSEKQNEMDSVAAIAESIQPKGNTLLTTSVVTKIPFLLKHSLREYQHIGLDWLVTMFERKLNGILADEMGLGKTIQTIALLAHLACEKSNWGPHLIIVPTSVMLNWEMECKKWCPGFKILTYYGSQKERKQKRTGWTKPNAFHICITSYKLVIQDHQSFRRKKWKYLILDEAQNIKNFKSQRWQLLLNFQTQRRLLLTGTPLQNNLMELWSLMHFLMPNVFQSHREFKEWFSNPVTGMIEGNSEYNENIIRRLHKVLRPFLLRRLKSEVEKQLPKKYEHVIVCRLSKRQRYLYDDFMSRAKTKETLACGNLLSVINVLMQLRKVCNHPNLFEVRPTVSPFQMEGIDFHTASLAWSALDYDPFKHVDLSYLNLYLNDLEFTHSAFGAHRTRRLKTPRKLIEEIDSQPDPPPRCPSEKFKINVRLSTQVSKSNTSAQQTPQQMKIKSFPGILPTPRVGTSPLIKTASSPTLSGQGVTLKVAAGQQLQGISVQLVPHQGGVKAIPVGTVAQSIQSSTTTSTTAGTNAQKLTVSNVNLKDGAQRLTHTYTVKHGDKQYQVPSFAQLVHTSTGRHIILASPNQTSNAVSFPVMTSTGQRLTVLSKNIMGLSTTPVSVNKVISNVVTSSTGGISARPVMRVPPLNVSTSQTAGQVQSQGQIRCGVVTRNLQKDVEKHPIKELPKSEFYLCELEEARRLKRQAKLSMIADVNERKCSAIPLYGSDLVSCAKITKPAKDSGWHSGWLHCALAKEPARTRRQYFSRTVALASTLKSTEQIVDEYKELFDKFVTYVPAARAPLPRFHVSHPPPSKLLQDQRLELELNRQLSSKLALFHPVIRGTLTQFPDVRLIQYDCGKLQSLDLLLRELKTDNHRVLIFTQMTRMLDVLEAFLNYHGYIYLRLDGATRVDQRQVLMERFNNDKRIFCFILSTRSGGVGVNLTGADTVVFYDSDWNPTMDAQAQDRCHRIGQTRDVHIYRLISERTVEENILKKANQKRLLGDLAIEGGNFTTAYFKSSTIQDLFNVDQSETDVSARMAEVLDHNKEREKHLQKEISPQEDKVAIGALENALAAVEEDLDVQAAKTAKAEAVADLAEFDENIPVEDADNDDAHISKAELEVQNLVSQLSPVERYAMRFVEESDGMFSAAQLAAAERELEEQKKEWELERLRAMREEEERRMRLTDDDENPITFTREDAQNQVNNSSNSRRRVKGRRSVSRPNKNAKISRQRVRESQRLSARLSSSQASRRSKRIRNEEEEEEEEESSSATSLESNSEQSLSESESQEDGAADEGSSDSESKDSQVEASNEEENDEDDEDESETEKKSPKNYLLNKVKKNHFDLNSPRTRSRGDVKINLWTLDVSPILPESKPRHRSKKPKNNTSVDKSEDGDDSKTMSDSFDQSTKRPVSVNTSADEKMSVEEETEMSEASADTNCSASESKPRRFTRSNVKSIDKDKTLNDSVHGYAGDVKSTTTEEKTQKVVNSDIQNSSDGKENIATTNKPGRPRKQSQSSQSVVVDSNSVTYSTRSNKLFKARLSQDKKLGLTIKINCKEELEICDINDTSNQSEKKIDSENNVPLEENNIVSDTSMSQGKPDVIESEDNTNQLEEQRSVSPILSFKKSKHTRSYSRIRSEPKSKVPIVVPSPVPDVTESELLSMSDNPNSSTDDDHLFSAMDIEEFSPEREVEEEQIVLQTSPILSSNMRFAKTARSAATTPSAIQEACENKQVTSCEINVKTIDKQTEDDKSTDEPKSSDAEPLPSVFTEASEDNVTAQGSTGKAADVDVQNEQQVKSKTRSLLRDVKTKIKDKDGNPAEQSIISNSPKDVPIFVSKIETGTKVKGDNDQQQPPVRIKITRSKDQTKLQVSNETHSESKIKSSNNNPEETKKSKSHEKQSSDLVGNIETALETPKAKLDEPTVLNKQTKESTVPLPDKKSNDESDVAVEHCSSSDSKSTTTDIVATAESKTPSKGAKAETLAISGVTTRRSRTNCSIETSSETDNLSQSTTETVASSSVSKPNEQQTVNSDLTNATSSTEKRQEKTIYQSDAKILEPGRVTRSNQQQVPNPLNRRFQQSLAAAAVASRPAPTGVVAGLRRRPDTPMPAFYSVRPVTRSLSGHNYSNNYDSSSDSDSRSSTSTSGLFNQKLSSRNSRSSFDNGFVVPSLPPAGGVRRARSTTYIKMSERLAMERKEIALPTTRGTFSRDSTVGDSLVINRIIAKRRPDTPMPTGEQMSRLTKPNTGILLPSPKPVSRLRHHIRRSLPATIPPLTSQASEQQQQSPQPKPQQQSPQPKARQQSPPPKSQQQSPQPKARQQSPPPKSQQQQPQTVPQQQVAQPQVQQQPPQPQQQQQTQSQPQPPPGESGTSQPQSTEMSVNTSGSEVESAASPLQPLVHEKTQRTAKVIAILSLDTKSGNIKTSNQSPVTPQKSKSHNAENTPVNSSRTSRLSRSTTKADSETNVAAADEQNETEVETGSVASDTTPRAHKRPKRTRLQRWLEPKSTTKPASPSGKEVQTVELEDDEDVIPIKRSTRFHPASTLRVSAASQLDKSSDNPTS